MTCMKGKTLYIMLMSQKKVLYHSLSYIIYLEQKGQILVGHFSSPHETDCSASEASCSETSRPGETPPTPVFHPASGGPHRVLHVLNTQREREIEAVDLYDERNTLGIRKRNTVLFHAVCQFITSMSTLISTVTLLTVLKFGCVYGPSITIERVVSTVAAWTSEEIYTHTHMLEMGKDTQDQQGTGGHQDLYKLIYQHDITTIKKLTDDELTTHDEASSEVKVSEGVSQGVILINDMWNDPKFSDENSYNTLSSNDISDDVNLGVEFGSDEYGEAVGHKSDKCAEHFRCELVKSAEHLEESVESAEHVGEIAESAVEVGGESVESAEHVGESVDSAVQVGGECVDSAEHVGGESVESDDHVGDDSVESTNCAGDDSVVSCDEESEGPVVRVHGGFIRGLTLDKAHVFYGIPYADPPVGQWRWTPPQPLTPWLHTYNATFPRPACMQACAGEFAQMCPPKVSEDCLYLNVFVPRNVNLSLTTTTLRPVLVWIHGGDFIAGSASRPLYDGRFISNYSNTLVVSIEYRLGAFGFLVTGKEPGMSAIGNYGIMDQQAALVWIKDNIQVFAGDPNRVLGRLPPENSPALGPARHWGGPPFDHFEAVVTCLFMVPFQ
ncbi:hypothetical protein ACEWY4_010275 [Coilia grayii]|uniref:Carboxylesterase type B domain-containing protein n=1 Tax=Coilia grayii TaxID=363190 RepID=A0ABD1K1G4_9TELE